MNTPIYNFINDWFCSGGYRSMSGVAGSGAGKGGGTGGSVRDAGGSFGKKEAAQEEQYFRQMVTITT